MIYQFCSVIWSYSGYLFRHNVAYVRDIIGRIWDATNDDRRKMQISLNLGNFLMSSGKVWIAFENTQFLNTTAIQIVYCMIVLCNKPNIHKISMAKMETNTSLLAPNALYSWVYASACLSVIHPEPNLDQIMPNYHILICRLSSYKRSRYYIIPQCPKVLLTSGYNSSNSNRH